MNATDLVSLDNCILYVILLVNRHILLLRSIIQNDYLFLEICGLKHRRVVASPLREIITFKTDNLRS